MSEEKIPFLKSDKFFGIVIVVFVLFFYYAMFSASLKFGLSAVLATAALASAFFIGQLQYNDSKLFRAGALLSMVVTACCVILIAVV
jgi:hypothetical protein